MGNFVGKNTLVVRDVGGRAKLVVPENSKLSGRIESGTSVDSLAWMQYLSSELIKSFRFEPKDDRLPSYLVRKEIRREGSEFWYAFKQTDEGLRKKYLGHTRALTYDKLIAIAFEYAGLVALPVKHHLDDLLRDDFKPDGSDPSKDVWQKLEDLSAENQRLIEENSAIKMEEILLRREVSELKQTVETMRKIHQMYKLTRMDNLVKLEQIITHWNEKAEGKQSRFDRTWQHALHLLRELNEALTLDLSGNAGVQPVAGGKN